MPIYRVQQDNGERLFLIDTGSDYSYLFGESYQKKTLQKRTITFGINGFKIKRLKYLLHFLFFSKGEKKNFFINEIYLNEWESPVDIVLGMNAFENKTLIFNNKNHEVYIK
ncbi:hypothetical protein HB912_01045 [Listeria aquatica]|uniref:Peptidase A2 domain-containing protein n=1 Tax=Listeria aquatica TaxID=1494960 RepID=A0A841ZNE5_9LIST|nr:hypothetical protein [Listeria aquatica]MBC1520231.1 hypothetical protein [Listeria aquatica]